jgi:hypothetical protein
MQDLAEIGGGSPARIRGEQRGEHAGAYPLPSAFGEHRREAFDEGSHVGVVAPCHISHSDQCTTF